MSKTLKALSALLSYPTTELQQASDELRTVLDVDALLPPTIADALDVLIDELATGDLYDLQERYVLLFDRTRSLSLHLFEHVHGESRDRGQAMIDLKSLYERHGLAIGAGELPDFLPLFLEFLSTPPLAEARDPRAHRAHILAARRARVHEGRALRGGVARARVARGAVPQGRHGVCAVVEPRDRGARSRLALDAP